MVTGGLPTPGRVTVSVVVEVVVVVIVTVVVDTTGVVGVAALAGREPAPHPAAPIAARPQATADPSQKAVERAPLIIIGRLSHSRGLTGLGVRGGLEPVV